MRCLVIIAHPDDETIWMGGTILSHPDWEWHIMSLSRGDDRDRAQRFQHAAREYGASACASDLDDSSVLAPLSEELTEIKERVRRLVSGEFDVVFTHGANGEYHHPRHEQVHRAVREMVSAGEMSGAILCFAYDKSSAAGYPAPRADADIVIPLTASIVDRKRHIVRDIYGFHEGSVEFEAAGPMEALSVDGLIGPSLSALRSLISPAILEG